MNADQQAMKDALDAITADFVATKATFVADPSSENWAEKKSQARQLQAAREVWRNNRPPEPPSSKQENKTRKELRPMGKRLQVIKGSELKRMDWKFMAQAVVARATYRKTFFRRITNVV